MLRRLWWLSSALLLLTLALAPGVARAQGKLPLVILTIDSDDAEEQAEGLTGALRSRARASGNWTLTEATQTLSMLTAALKCPAKPDPACLDKISAQLKAERFIWGTMAKSPGNQVTADLHFYARGKPDFSVHETYSDNLRDQNDESLRKIAAHAFDKLTGSATGTVTVHAGEVEGDVWVDGQKRGELVKGDLTLELLAGQHTVEVRARGYAPARQQVLVSAGKNIPFNAILTPEGAGSPDRGPEKPIPVVRILGWAAIGVGAGLGIASVVVGARYFSESSDQDARLAKIPSGINACDAQQNNTQAPWRTAADEACQKAEEWDKARVNAIVLAAAGGALVATGVIVLLTDSSSPEAPARDKKTAKRDVKLEPRVGPAGGAVLLSGSF
jgi:hypothetical protein